MSRTRIVKGNVTEITGGNYKIYSGGDCEYHVGKQMKQVAKQTTYGTPEKAPKKQSPTRVKEIERITPLDDGSANDGSGGTQKGFIFGKTYEFKVKSFTNGNPISNQLIKWTQKYHNLSNNQWTEVPLNTRGDTLKLTLNDPEMCGRFVYIRAYIDDEDNEGELKIWKHNRFRWFDRKVIDGEIKERTDDKKPWLVNQSGTSLCGMACIFYLFAKEQPEAYKKFAKTLFRTGEATFNKYTVKPSEELFEKKTRKNNKGEVVTVGTYMPLIDFVTMAGTRNTDNPDYKGGDEEFQAINWPPLMTTLSENLLGYKYVSSKGVYNPIAPLAYTSLDTDRKIKHINEQLSAGYRLILMIDSDLIDDVWDVDSFDLHWIVLESEIKEVKMLNQKGQTEELLDFRVYSYGTNPFDSSRYLKRPITKIHFMNNYNGYVKIK